MALASASQAQTVKKETSEPFVNHERDPHIFIKIQERAYSLFQVTGFKHDHDFEPTGWKRKTGRRLFGCESDSSECGSSKVTRVSMIKPLASKLVT